jgi:hypothetical protein
VCRLKRPESIRNMTLSFDTATRLGDHSIAVAPEPVKTVDPYIELKRVIADRGLLVRAPRRQILPSAGHVLLLAVW